MDKQDLPGAYSLIVHEALKLSPTRFKALHVVTAVCMGGKQSVPVIEVRDALQVHLEVKKRMANTLLKGLKDDGWIEVRDGVIHMVGNKIARSDEGGQFSCSKRAIELPSRGRSEQGQIKYQMKNGAHAHGKDQPVYTEKQKKNIEAGNNPDGSTKVRPVDGVEETLRKYPPGGGEG